MCARTYGNLQLFRSLDTDLKVLSLCLSLCYAYEIQLSEANRLRVHATRTTERQKCEIYELETVCASRVTAHGP